MNHKQPELSDGFLSQIGFQKESIRRDETSYTLTTISRTRYGLIVRHIITNDGFKSKVTLSSFGRIDFCELIVTTKREFYTLLKMADVDVDYKRIDKLFNVIEG